MTIFVSRFRVEHAGVTRLLQETLGKNPATTIVVTDEVETDNRGIGGETVTTRRQGGR